VLIIFAGLPASGKSTIARAIARETGAVWIRIDSIEQALRTSHAPVEPVADEGYVAGYAVAADNLRLGRIVIADSVNPIDITRDAWRKVATDAGCESIDVEVICSDVEEHKRRVETRSVDIADLKLPNWQAVLDREYHAWDQDRIVIDTAGRKIDACVEELQSRIEGATGRARLLTSPRERWKSLSFSQPEQQS
jgi:predicted kinase